jgi:hypothetical protein
MPSPDDRLQELRRQRALAQEQLAWLDREIAAASGEPVSAKPLPQNLQAAPTAHDDDVEALLESYRAESRRAPDDARRGCFILFFAALALLALGVLALYFYMSSHRLLPR